MHQALELIHYIVTDTSYQTNGHDDVSPMMLNGDSGIALGGPQPRAHKALREFDVSRIFIRRFMIRRYWIYNSLKIEPKSVVSK